MGKSWKNASKSENSAKKGLMFTKLAREIQVAAKMGGADPNMNARLRAAIDAAKKESCPNDTIDRAIKKGAGIGADASAVEEITYEGYGPHGVGVIIECQTDNKHRTAPEVRNVFKKHDCAMGEVGSVGWMFARMGYIEGVKTGTFDPEEEAIEAGADAVEPAETGFGFWTSVETMNDVRQALEKRGWKIGACELSYKAKNITDITEAQQKDVSEFLNALDDLDDTHRVHATI